jgi:hypothetical protein
MYFLASTSKFQVLETLKKSRSCRFFGNPRWVIQISASERDDGWKIVCAYGFFKTYALIRCMIFQ